MASAQFPPQRALTNSATPRNPTGPLAGYSMNLDRPQNLGGPSVGGPAIGGIYSANISRADLKRKNESGAGGRSRPGIGGSPQGEIDIVRSLGVPNSVSALPLGQTFPSLTGWRPGSGAAIMSGMPEAPIDTTIRGITPIGARPDAAGWMWNGMPTQPDNYFRGFIGTRPNVGAAVNQGPFNMPGSSQGLPGGRLYPFETAADREKISYSDDSGTPNPRVKYTFLLSKKACAYALPTMAYQPVFGIRDPTPIDESTPLTNGHAFLARAETTIFDLVVTNYELAMAQKRAAHPGEVCTPRDVLTDYRFLGICAAEEGNSSSYSNATLVNRSLPRNLVVTLGGSAFSVLNYWDDKLTYGSNVGFILKGVPLKDLVARNGATKGTFNLDPSTKNVHSVNLSITAPVVLQFVPWFGGPAETPNAAALAYVDQFGCDEIGVYIPVGQFLQYHGDIGDRQVIKRAWCSREAAVHAGTIALLVSRNTPAF